MMAQEVGRELSVSKKNHIEDMAEVPDIKKAGDNAAAEVVRLQKVLAARDQTVNQLKNDVAAALQRAHKAEDLHTRHAKQVADLEEVASRAKTVDNTSSNLSTKMANRLHEAQKKLPILEQEAADYRDHVERMVGEMNALKEQFPKHDAEVERLKAEIQAAKAEARQWQTKAERLEEKVNPLTEKMEVLEGQFREAQVMKEEVVKDAHRNRKRAAEAEEEAGELAKHVERLVEQLKRGS